MKWTFTFCFLVFHLSIKGQLPIRPLENKDQISFPQNQFFDIEGTLLTNKMQGIPSATIEYTHDCSNNCTIPSSITPVTGTFGACDICLGCNNYTITPSLDLDPLNGVNTYDLVLISRHILGLEPLNTPYKVISADANRSNSITTFDIVELRKLILGTYVSMSQIITPGDQQKSWRFVDKSQVFSTPMNPFTEQIRDMIIVNHDNFPAQHVDFIGCKIGDVDLTAIPNERPSPRPPTTLAFPVLASKSSPTTLTVPVTYTGTEPLDAIQFALRFDPAIGQLVAPSVGTIQGLSLQNFGLQSANDGKINFSWHVTGLEIPAIQPGDILFNLTFITLGNTVPNIPMLTIDPSVMAEGGWNSAGIEYQLLADEATAMRTAVLLDEKNAVTVTPNPTTGAAQVQFTATKNGKTRVVLADAFGNQMSLRDVSTTPGDQNIELSELQTLPAGVYIWWIKMPNGAIQQGRIVKQ